MYSIISILYQKKVEKKSHVEHSELASVKQYDIGVEIQFFMSIVR